MSRELDGVRDLVAEQTERLEKLFPGKNQLWQRDIAEKFNISKDYVRERYGVGRDGIDLVSFAWILARRGCRIEQRAVCNE